MNTQTIIADWQFAALLGFVVLAPVALTLWEMICDARDAREVREARRK